MNFGKLQVKHKCAETVLMCPALWMPCVSLFQVVELKLGGKDIPVTTANRIAYIHLVADYRLNKQIRPHCLAFRQGLANVVNLEWLRMFDQQEIQVLNFWTEQRF